MKQINILKGKDFLKEGDESSTAHILLSGKMEGLVQTNPKALLAIIKVLSNRLRSTLKAMEGQEA
ncbi:MAG: hypothetical protein HOJ79_06620 [Nitrospina sp.]|jgi:hypothetical protein|nr:hypothetical protein [Nitrospina sp.]